jgi:hypothetical protein
MRRLLGIALILSVSHGYSAFAAGPLLASAMRAARQLAEPSADTPNAAKAKRVATNLGPGRHVAVKLTTGTTLRGHLEAVRDDHFVLRLDGDAASLDVAYRDVQKLGPNLGTATKTAIWLAVAVVGTAWAYETFSETRGTR